MKWPSLNFPPINLWNVWKVQPKDSVLGNMHMGFTHKECEFFPCHPPVDLKTPSKFNCLFCNCPLYWLECPGIYDVITDASGGKRKDCSQCLLPHDGYRRSWLLMNLSKYQTKPVLWKGD